MFWRSFRLNCVKKFQWMASKLWDKQRAEQTRATLRERASSGHEACLFKEVTWSHCMNSLKQIEQFWTVSFSITSCNWPKSHTPHMVTKNSRPSEASFFFEGNVFIPYFHCFIFIYVMSFCYATLYIFVLLINDLTVYKVYSTPSHKQYILTSHT